MQEQSEAEEKALWWQMKNWSGVLWRWRKGPQAKENRWPPEAERGEEIHCPPRASRGNESC